jgi:hypothetical protein
MLILQKNIDLVSFFFGPKPDFPPTFSFPFFNVRFFCAFLRFFVLFFALRFSRSPDALRPPSAFWASGGRIVGKGMGKIGPEENSLWVFGPPAAPAPAKKPGAAC